MIVILRVGRGFNPLSPLAAVLVVSGLFFMARGRSSPPPPEGPACETIADRECAVVGEVVSPLGDANRPSAPVLDAEAACGSAGYLCSDLGGQDRITVRRWKAFSGTVVVHVPAPSFEDRAEARELQRAAAAGIRLWNGQPFPISVVEREGRGEHFSVRWTSSLGGSQIGVARTQWSPARGLEVISLELATRSPYDPGRVNSPRQVRLTAAHEMGHALGLPHSDSERDVMYPTNTATSLSPQDYRTMAALYELDDGTVIVR